MNNNQKLARNDLTCAAAEIRAEHLLARQHADRAIKHAKAAGELLLHCKEQLTHGQFLPWLAQHCQFSPRQAQRYMRVARGEEVPIRKLKSDVVSPFIHWLPPEDRHLYHSYKHVDRGEIMLIVEVAPKSEGYHVLRFEVDVGAVTGIPEHRGPLARHKVATLLRMFNVDPISAQWIQREIDPQNPTPCATIFASMPRSPREPWQGEEMDSIPRAEEGAGGGNETR